MMTTVLEQVRTLHRDSRPIRENTEADFGIEVMLTQRGDPGMETTPELFLSIKELAALTGISAKTLHAQAAKGVLPLPTLKFGSRYLIPRKALEELVGPISLRSGHQVQLPFR